MKKYNKALFLTIPLILTSFITACNTKPTVVERNKNITIENPFSNTSSDGQCYKITAENKDYYGRLDKDGHPLLIPELENKDIKINLSLLSDNDCKAKGL
ncbi:hypothetical protein [Providencia sp.]|uniref:hypothetical protein n=1 Tax=Providencia sp. TaxID=589 RepID=UPI003F96FAB3